MQRWNDKKAITALNRVNLFKEKGKIGWKDIRNNENYVKIKRKRVKHAHEKVKKVKPWKNGLKFLKREKSY